FGAGFTSAVPIALVQRSKWGCVLEEWLVMAAIKDSLELDRYLVGRIRSKWPDDEKHLFIKLFANFLGTIHEFGVFHTDLKTCNIIVTNPNLGVMSISPEINDFNPVSFSLIDYDDVRYFSSGVNMEKRAKNLAQLFLSTPSDINLADRSEFLRLYLDVCAKNPDYGAKLLKAAKKRMKGKTLLYVGPDGDITEDWPQHGLEECCYHGLGKS
ncbi:MAG: lipopolysaccharide kinase InaA family protein, partial [Pseudomonadota bacterium]